ncbi:MAG TPA: hypothetical protein VFH29_03835 [Anaerolineales bacterium]|nr:hypothetical protein [Anaerolineales bacterium]
MKVLALEHDRPGATSADFAPHLDAEARAVWEMTQSGTIRETYFREDRSEAVILLEAPSTEAARTSLSQLPLVRQGLIEFEVIGLLPYPGFSRLFKE